MEVQAEQELKQFLDLPIQCDLKDSNCKLNQNPAPTFRFPTPSSNYLPDEAETTDLITTMSNEITTLWKNVIETSASAINNANIVTSTSTENIIHATINDIIPLQPNNNIIIDEDTASNNTNILGIIENVSNSSIIEMMQNATTSNNINDLGINEAVSNSSFVEMMQNNTISIGVVDNDTHLPEAQTITTLISTTAENVASIIYSTTEKAMSVVTESVKDVFSTMKQNQDTDDHFKQYHMNDYEHSHNWIYILLGIIAGILILIGIILFLIYIRYRKHSLLPVHNYYEISPMKESCSPLPHHIQHEQEKQCPTEVYLQYST